MKDYNCVLVCAEIIDNRLANMSSELLGAGAKLAADLGRPLSALVIGANPDEAAVQAISMGADKVLTIDSPPFLASTPDYYAALINDVSSQTKPSVILMAHGDMGRDVAPRVAAKAGNDAAATLDCTDVAIDPATKELLLTKPVYGGNAIAIWASSHFPHVVTLRPGSVPPAASDPARKGEIAVFQLQTADGPGSKTRLLQKAGDESTGARLEDASVIVAGGAGVGGKDGLKMLEELAELLGAAVGVTRVPCDLGWAPISMEIGQTGHIVSPDLYIAIGISGAPQHIAGCLGSKIIVAINRDADANIFKVSDFGVTGDYLQVLPPFIERIKSLKGR